ncbi:MAG TPA: acetyl-CoA carboxylase biotin carboxylase subunit [Dehalococcoidia bacterium]|nr:acetyl-CoA carboxylase biotin carboxylase subunit [Dehalococcoidia bacterium]
MFRKVLIANRGEIAVRIARACRDVGVGSVAVFSEADRFALHTRLADEAHYIGPSPVGESYLSIERLLEAARTTGADAVHPGYGLLSENATFAQRCLDTGLTWIGPSPEAIAAMGDKRAARRRMAAAGVPVVPGSEGVDTAEDALRAAEHVGFPLLVKAAAGGGGRGMRLVRHPDELESNFHAAKAEAEAAFGDGSLYLERYLVPARHIEIQIVGDHHGNYAALSERECSIQRRHQKVIEEAPSVVADASLRSRMAEASLAAARAVQYTSLGTLEFLVDECGEFYFLEMNTRVQVEHPVTEMITGHDLVADQIRIAAGLPLAYEGLIEPRGWSIECRIAAEDPYNNFLPSLGRIASVRKPGGPGVRVDSSLFDGMEISPYYDSLVAKLITWGRDRPEAITRMRRALREFVVVGVATNIPFHRQVMEDPDFLEGRLDTGYLDRFRFRDEMDQDALRLAMLAAVAHRFQTDERGAPRQTEPRRAAGWRQMRTLGSDSGERGWRRAIS